ncbi:MULTISPECIES: hypothetical protein [unclassified Desulfovibrio]|uniref:hypothetical protein n=1 Tax=unclassified Desulfovibrio TaxID=2593640 RepID=UPI0013EAF083|nr:MULTISPECIES: hypothetical protein [unclassified Desulfovibrio]
MAPNHDENGAQGSLPPGRRLDEGRVFDAEVVGADEGERTAGRAQSGAGQGGSGGDPWRHGSASGARFYRMGGTFGNGAGFGRVWTATGADGAGCLAPCVTFALFFVCVSQFGLLAGIGFVVFHLAGSIAGTIRSMRRLVEGRPPNPWAWRLGNWFVSFMLTAWLAGGFNG